MKWKTDGVINNTDIMLHSQHISHSVYVEFFFFPLNLWSKKDLIHTQWTKKPRQLVSVSTATEAYNILAFSNTGITRLSRSCHAVIKVPGHDTGYCCSPLHRAQVWQWASPEGSWTLGRLRKEGPGWCGGDGGSGASDYGSAGSQTAEGQTAVSSQPACTLSGCAPSRGALKMALCKESAGGNKRVTWASPHLYSHQTSFFRCHLIEG